MAGPRARIVSLFGVSTPVFWLALVALYIFYVRLGWVAGPGRLDAGMAAPPHVTGLYTVDALLAGQWATFSNVLSHLILPALVLASYTTGLIARVTRSSMLEVLHMDYIRTARAKGLANDRIVMRHALRNALDPAHHRHRLFLRQPAGRHGADRGDLCLAGHRPVRLPGLRPRWTFRPSWA